MSHAALSRRALLGGGGALIVSFAMPRSGIAQQAASPPLPDSLKTASMLDAWIGIGADGGVTVFTGKSELGQGIRTALVQVAAEQDSMRTWLGDCNVPLRIVDGPPSLSAVSITTA